MQPNFVSALGALPTLLGANPVASPISHVFLHVTAVLHAPETDLFQPPHSASSGGAAGRGHRIDGGRDRGQPASSPRGAARAHAPGNRGPKVTPR